MKKYFTASTFLLLLFLLASTSERAVAQCASFYDGFESGVLGPQWTIGTGTYTRTVQGTNSAVGTYHFEQACTGTNSFYQGTYAVFTPSQPTYMSWWMRTNTTTAANGYVVVGNSNVNTDNGIIFCYFNNTSGLRFFNTAGYNHPITANTWYHVECRNMNWVARTCDIWVNGTQILTGWAFRSTSAMNVDRIHFHSLSASVAKYDEIQIGIGGVTIDSVMTVDPTCFGDSTGTIDVSATSTNGISTYAWSGGGSGSTLTNLPAGTYTVTITDSAGCTQNGSYTLSSTTQIVAPGVTTSVVCPGAGTGAVDLSVTGGTPGYTYVWSNNDTTQDISNLAGGPYTVTVTDINGCEGVSTFVINEPAAFQGTATVTPPLCPAGQNGTISYNITGGTPGYTYFWPNGDTTATTTVPAGTYGLIIRDTLNCIFIDTITVSDPTGVSSNPTIQSPACNGFGNGSITLNPSGGTPGYTYLWSNNASSPGLPAATAGTYYVSITDANGCVSVDSFVVTEPSVLVSSGTVTNSTSGGNNGGVNLTVNGGTPPYTYAWSNSTNNQNLSGVNGPANYTVIITDANGCVMVDTFFVDDVIAVRNNLGTTVTAFPNPFNDRFTIEVSGLGMNEVSLTLTDMTGRVIWAGNQSGDGRQQVSATIASGMYLLRMVQNGQESVIRLQRQ
ncbi:MAG: T9SS type A sorting domain-containing protein [Bacteroidia bacterium]